MGPAWVGPLYWIQWAGGHRRLTSPRAADRSGRRTAVSRTARRADARARGRRVRSVRDACPPIDADLAENRPWPVPRADQRLPPRELRARWASCGSVSGAHSRRTAPARCRRVRRRCAGVRAACPRGRGVRGRMRPSGCRAAASGALSLRGSMVTEFVRCTGCPQPVEAAMRWLVGWSSTAADACGVGDGRAPATGRRRRAPCTRSAPNSCGATRIRCGRSATGGPTRCASSQADAADPARRPRHAAAPPTKSCGSACSPRAAAHCAISPPGPAATRPSSRSAAGSPSCGDLAGARPVFYTPWAGGTAYATAALPARRPHRGQPRRRPPRRAARLPRRPRRRCATAPRTTGVRRIPPGHALILRDGRARDRRVRAGRLARRRRAPADPDSAVDGVRDALVEAVRARLSAPRHVPERRRRPRPGARHGARRTARRPRDAGSRHRRRPVRRQRLRHARPAGRRAARDAGHASSATAPGAGERLLAVTFNDLAVRRAARPSWSGPATLAANPRLHHVVVAGGEEALPVRRPGRARSPTNRALPGHRRTPPRAGSRRAAPTTSPAHGARQVLDAHPARLADLLMDRRGAICCARSPRWPRPKALAGVRARPR